MSKVIKKQEVSSLGWYWESLGPLHQIYPWVLIIFHLIGIGIFLLPDRVVGLSGFNMLLCALLVFATAADKPKELLLFAFIFLGGFGVEFIGVNTGVLFGSYAYGNELGWKVGGVPVVLGLNWYCVVAAASHFVKRFVPSNRLWLNALLVGGLCVLMDFLIEPVAIRFDFWQWEGGHIPIFNYVCWGVFSALFAFVYLNFITKENLTAWALYLIWIVFFIVLILI